MDSLYSYLILFSILPGIAVIYCCYKKYKKKETKVLLIPYAATSPPPAPPPRSQISANIHSALHYPTTIIQTKPIYNPTSTEFVTGEVPYYEEN